MVFHENGTICGLPSCTGIVPNGKAAYINDILLVTVNSFCAIFALLSNLAIIVAVTKNSLQKHSDILLCSLTFADCLTGVNAQPMFVVWRFFLQRAQQSCSHQVLVFDVYYRSPRAKPASGALLLRKFGNLSIREILVLT